MTDETINMEPVAVEPGATEPPVQPPSDNTTEPSAVDVEAMKEYFESAVEDVLERQSQSIKDKRFAKQENRISNLEDTLAEVKALQAEGMSEKQAIQYMRTQELLDAQGEQVPADAPPPTGPAVPTTVAVDEPLSAILNLAGLDSGEAEVVAILKQERDPLKQVVALTALAESRKQAKTTPAAVGNTLPMGTGATVTGDTLETITEQLKVENAKPKKDFEKIKELRKKNLELLPKE
jgi:hypothetical protein